MPEIGVRELKTRALEQPREQVTQDDPWKELLRLGALIGVNDEVQSATELLLEMRVDVVNLQTRGGGGPGFPEKPSQEK